MKGPTGNTTQKRLRILRDDEIDALYGVPIANGQKTTIWAENPAFPAVELLESHRYWLSFMGLTSLL